MFRKLHYFLTLLALFNSVCFHFSFVISHHHDDDENEFPILVKSDVNYNTLGPVSRLSHGSSHRVFNVDDFGAKGDGTDDRKVQLKPLMDQLARVKDFAVPEFGTLLAWELRASAAARAANGDANGNDPSKSSQNGYGGPPMPFFGETKVEVAFSGTEGQEDKKSEVDHTSLKVLPPWMIKQGMNLTKEQRGGEVKQEAKMDGGVSTTETSEDKKSITENDDKKNLQDEYVKAYYAALLEKQKELEAATKQEELSNAQMLDGEASTSSSRQVGMKSKRVEDEGEEDVEWEEAAPVAAGNANEPYKVDLNVEADATADNEEDDDDDVDWEEG